MGKGFVEIEWLKITRDKPGCRSACKDKEGGNE
jgi:hypothetical protein